VANHINITARATAKPGHTIPANWHLLIAGRPPNHIDSLSGIHGCGDGSWTCESTIKNTFATYAAQLRYPYAGKTKVDVEIEVGAHEIP